MDDRQKADVVSQVVSGALNIRDACARYQVSSESILRWVVDVRRSALQAFDQQLRLSLASQGIDTDDIATAAFTGTLGEIAIPDLIQTLAFGRRDGVITVLHENRESRIWCAAGEIVDAESGKLKGTPALYRILSLERGHVSADLSRVERPRRITSSTTALLLESACRTDECNARRKKLGTGSYRIAPSAIGTDAQVATTERAVLQGFSAPSSVLQVLEESALGDLETLTVISQLVEKGFLLPHAESGSAPLAALPPDSLSSAPLAMSFLAPVASERARASRSMNRLAFAFGLCALGLTSWFLVRHPTGTSREMEPTSGSSRVTRALAVPSSSMASATSANAEVVERAEASEQPNASLVELDVRASRHEAAHDVTARERVRKPRVAASAAAALAAARRSVESESETETHTGTETSARRVQPRIRTIEGRAPSMQIVGE